MLGTYGQYLDINDGLPAKLPPTCKSQVYCTGPLLNFIQLSGIFNDSQTFVDLKCKKSPEETIEKFNDFLAATQTPSKTQIEKFVKDNFDNVSSEYQKWIPTDYNPNPKFIDNINSPTYQLWAYDLNKLLRDLGRKQNPDVNKNPDRYSIIPLPRPMILQSRSARELEYWDNYWTILGILACEMYDVSIIFKHFKHSFS